MTVTVELAGLELFGRHGALEEEQRAGQRFLFDVWLDGPGEAARTEADAIISRTRADAARAGEEMKTKARADAENIIRNAERQIELEASRAVETIRREAVDLSVAIASKLIQRNITKEDNERLIGETLKEIESKRVN